MCEPLLDSSAANLPVVALFPELARALVSSHVVLEAPPGAGKSTALPLWLLENKRGDKQASKARRNPQMILIQPRRVAAISIAHYLAECLGESVGERIGFHVRGHRNASARTELLVVTEGIFTRLVQADSELQDVDVILFDEFHERNLHSDLGLALAIEVVSLRDDLRLLVMSATLPGAVIEDWLKQQGLPTCLLSSEGRQYPIQTYYRPPARLADWRQSLHAVIGEALKVATQGVLVFVPGQREIRQLARELTIPADVTFMTLHGNLPLAEQRAAMKPAPRGRKLVIATNVAETSLTISGIDVVVDSGRERQAHHDPNYGMTRLVTRMIPRASAVQRAGRAGRTGPGKCFRLWSEGHTERLDSYGVPAIEREDLSQLLLEVLCWGARPEQLSWLTQPSPVLLAHGKQVLEVTRAIEHESVTSIGRRMASWGTDVRFSASLASVPAPTALHAFVIASLEEREGDYRGDLLSLLQQQWQRPQEFPRTHRRWSGWRQQLKLVSDNASSPSEEDWLEASTCLLFGFADRVAQRQNQRYQLATGLAAHADESCLTDWMIALDLLLSDASQGAQIWTWLPIAKSVLEGVRPDFIESHTTVRWRGSEGGLERLLQKRWGRLLLAESPSQQQVTAEERGEAFAQLITSEGLRNACAWTNDIEQWLNRRQCFARHFSADEQAWTDAALVASVTEWAAPYLVGLQRRSELRRWSPLSALRARDSYDRQKQFEQLLPTHWVAPSGRRHVIQYGADGSATLALKLQEVFGTPSSPRVADGRITLVFDLLSPAGRSLHRTADLASFWQSAWPEVRKEMRGRYPKHPWPEDPCSAEATHLTKRALSRRASNKGDES